MPSELRSDRQGSSLVLTLMDEACEGLSTQILAACVEALNVAETMQDIRAVVWHHQGRIAQPHDRDPHFENHDHAGLAPLLEAIRTFPKPVVAAVEGPITGPSTALVLACDLIAAASNSQMDFKQAIHARSPEKIEHEFLRLFPRHLVQQLAWLPEPLSAERLNILGIVNWITPPGQALLKALVVTRTLEDLDASVLQQWKESISSAFISR